MHHESRMVRRSPRRLIAVLGATALLAAGCSGGSGSDDGGGGQASCGGEQDFTMAINLPPRSLDPAQLDDGLSAYVWSGIFDTLLFLGEDGEVGPNAAEEWEYSEDRRTLTLTLREGMTFSNGDPVDAEAARATIERTRTTPSRLQGKFAAVESVEAPDPRTVVLNLSRPDPSLLVSLAMAAGAIGHPPTFADPNTTLDPVGSGPYVLSDATAAGSNYVLEKRDDYWNAEQFPFQTVTLRVIGDPTAVVNALLGNELNAAFAQSVSLQRIEAAGYSISEPLPSAIFGLILADREGTIAPPLADVRVRQAINMAIDREGIVRSILSGAATPTEQYFSKSNPAYAEDLEGTYEFDPDAARELLAEAGYADGFSLTMPSTLISQRYEPTLSQLLGDVGIDVTWEPVPPANTASSLQSRQYPAVLWAQGGLPAPLEVTDRYGENAQLNPFDVPSPEVTDLLAQIAEDPDGSADAYEEIGRIAVEEAHFAPIVYSNVQWATSECVQFLGTEANSLGNLRRFGVPQ